MAEAEIKIGIRADADGMVRGVKQADDAITILKGQLQRLQKIASLPDLSFKQQERLNDLLRKTQSELVRFQKAAELTQPAVHKFNTVSNQSALALNNLSRVAQDAPFGFLGIANNINPLLESFQRLKQTTGTTGGALKALASSLGGAGGLGLAVGILSSLLVVFGDKLFKTKSAAEKLADANKKIKEATEAARQATEDFVSSLSDLDQARVKGQQDANKEIVSLQQLYAATQNTNLSLKERTKAVDALQKMYPAYFKNISDEIILAGGAKNAYDKLTASIIATAKARAGQERLAKIYDEAYVTQEQLIELTAKETAAWNELAAAKEKAAKAGKFTVEKGVNKFSGSGTTAESLRETRAEEKYLSLQKERKKVGEALEAQQRRGLTLAEQLAAAVGKDGVETIIPDKGIAKAEKLKKVVEAIKIEWQQIKALVTQIGDGQQKSYIPKFEGEAGKSYFDRLAIQRLTKNVPSFNPPQLSDDEKKRIKEITEAYKEQAKVISELVAPAFVGMFDAIVAGENPIKAFFDGIGQALQKLIQQLIVAAIQALAFNLITSGGAGTFGQLFGGSAKSLLGFGGISAPGAAGFGNGMRGALNSVNGTSFRGSGMSVNVTGTLQGRGSNLVAVISQTTQQQNRNF